MRKLYIGIDPGIDGALAALAEDFCRTTVMPIIEGTAAGSKSTLDIDSIARWLKAAVHDCPVNGNSEVDVLVGIEKVNAFRGQGITSAFNFGQTFGMLQAIVRTLNYPLELVRPQAWKKVILEGTLKDKTAAIQYVKQRFPKLDLHATERCRTDHDGIAEAICIAEYIRRVK